MTSFADSAPLISVLTLVMAINCALLILLVVIHARREAREHLERIAAPAGKSPADTDQVRVLRRSLRCFLFGLAGTIPWCGLAMAGLAFSLQRQVARETNETFSLRLVHLSWVCGLILASFCLMGGIPFAAIGTTIVFLMLQGYILSREYRDKAGGAGNPARHLVYWGVGLAYAGCVLSVLVLLIILLPAPE